MRKMSLDVGTRTIGIAVSDLLGMIANGVETIKRTTEERDYARIAELIKEHEVDTLVVGYPKNMNGTIGERAQACEAMEMGAAAIMANTALATAGDLPMMAAAFRQAIEAGRRAYLSGLGRVLTRGASASDPLTGFLRD